MRLAFGAATGVDEDGETIYDWGRHGWGDDGNCLSNSLGDEKPRFYLSARQAAEILAAPGAAHEFGEPCGDRSVKRSTRARVRHGARARAGAGCRVEGGVGKRFLHGAGCRSGFVEASCGWS